MKQIPINPSDPSDVLIQPGKENIPALTEALICLMAGLWEKPRFTDAGAERCRSTCRQYLLNCAQPFLAYSRICCEVLSFYEQQRLPYHTLPDGNAASPCRLLGAILENSELNPGHGKAYGAFSEAILEMIETPSAANYHYWQRWFRESERELHLFNQFIHCMNLSL